MNRFRHVRIYECTTHCITRIIIISVITISIKDWHSSGTLVNMNMWCTREHRDVRCSECFGGSREESSRDRFCRENIVITCITLFVYIIFVHNYIHTWNVSTYIFVNAICRRNGKEKKRISSSVSQERHIFFRHKVNMSCLRNVSIFLLFCLGKYSD